MALKNGRTAEENAELVKKNPFIPYSILMERSVLERFQKNGEELYTSFPIPIIVKEELEQEQEHVDSRFAAYGNVHFYVMFNTHLLDREELEKILGKIRREIEDLKRRWRTRTPILRPTEATGVWLKIRRSARLSVSRQKKRSIV